MKTKSILHIIGILFIGLLTGCSDESDAPGYIPSGEVSEVDINLTFGTGWTVDIGESRAAPPGTGGNNDNNLKVDGEADMSGVDKVRVIAFKKRENATGSFVYDVANDQILNVEPETVPGNDGKPAGHTHFVAHGKLKKTYGFQYRVIAVAYSSTKLSLFPRTALELDESSTFSMPDGEQNWFTLNTEDEPMFENISCRLDNVHTIPGNVGQTDWRDFIKGSPSYNLAELSGFEKKAGPLSRNVAQTPQLFYGTLHSENGNEIIGYSEYDKKGDLRNDLDLTGVLYRGVAKLTINLKLSKTGSGKPLDPKKYVKWIALVADEVNTEVNLSSYDGFLNPTKSGISSGYTAVNYMKLGETGYTDGDVKPLSTWFLPTKTRLALRIKDQNDEIYNYQIKTTESQYSDGNGTGIISPDVVDGVFYLRRNHKYNIVEIDIDKLMKSSHELK